jgi:hypothetical protein
LTDSIQAVEAAWGKVASDIGQDRAYVIAATHGKRAVDNLAQFKPQIKQHEMDDEVQKFEESILYFADAYNKHGPGSLPASLRGTPTGGNTPLNKSTVATPSLTPGSSAPSSRANSFSISGGSRRPSFATKLSNMLAMSVVPEDREIESESPFEIDEPITEEEREELMQETLDAIHKRHKLEAWQIEATSVDRSVQILPGVKRMMGSIPKGRYAVATSGAKTYGELS